MSVQAIKCNNLDVFESYLIFFDYTHDHKPNDKINMHLITV